MLKTKHYEYENKTKWNWKEDHTEQNEADLKTIKHGADTKHLNSIWIQMPTSSKMKFWIIQCRHGVTALKDVNVPETIIAFSTYFYYVADESFFIVRRSFSY